jgi:hypothetical protein
MIENNLIKNGIRRSFETGTSKIADKVCYMKELLKLPLSRNRM